MTTRIIGPEPDREAIAAMTELDHIRARATGTGPRGYVAIVDVDTLRADCRRLLEMLDQAYETINDFAEMLDEREDTRYEADARAATADATRAI